MKILSALKQIEFAAKLFAAAGFNFETAFAAKNENALRAHIDAAVAAAPARTVEPTAEQLQSLVTAELTAQLANTGLTIPAGHSILDVVKAKLAAASVIEAQLSASGFKLAAADPKAGITAADVKSAIDARVSVAAAELTAAVGTRPIESAVSASPTEATKTTEKLTGLAKTEAAYATSLKGLIGK